MINNPFLPICKRYKYTLYWSYINANMYMKKCSISFDIREIQIKTAFPLEWHIHTQRLNMTIPKVDKYVEQLLIDCCWKCEMVWSLLKIVWQLLIKSNIYLSYDAAISLSHRNVRAGTIFFSYHYSHRLQHHTWT